MTAIDVALVATLARAADRSAVGMLRELVPHPSAEIRLLVQLGLARAGDVERLYNIVDALDAVAREMGKTVAQVALAWVLQRPTVASVVIGARTEAQLVENLGAVGWTLDATHVAALDAASDVRPIYPYWHQRLNPRLMTPPPR